MAAWTAWRGRLASAFGGARPATDAAPGPAGAAPAPGSSGSGDWAVLPPVQRRLDAPLSTTARFRTFADQLTTHRNPSFLAPLSHRVSADGGGLGGGLVDLAPGEPRSYAATGALAVPPRVQSKATTRAALQRSTEPSAEAPAPTQEDAGPPAADAAAPAGEVLEETSPEPALADRPVPDRSAPDAPTLGLSTPDPGTDVAAAADALTTVPLERPTWNEPATAPSAPGGSFVVSRRAGTDGPPPPPARTAEGPLLWTEPSVALTSPGAAAPEAPGAVLAALAPLPTPSLTPAVQRSRIDPSPDVPTGPAAIVAASVPGLPIQQAASAEVGVPAGPATGAHVRPSGPTASAPAVQRSPALAPSSAARPVLPDRVLAPVPLPAPGPARDAGSVPLPWSVPELTVARLAAPGAGPVRIPERAAASAPEPATAPTPTTPTAPVPTAEVTEPPATPEPEPEPDSDGSGGWATEAPLSGFAAAIARVATDPGGAAEGAGPEPADAAPTLVQRHVAAAPTAGWSSLPTPETTTGEIPPVPTAGSAAGWSSPASARPAPPLSSTPAPVSWPTPEPPAGPVASPPLPVVARSVASPAADVGRPLVGGSPAADPADPAAPSPASTAGLESVPAGPTAQPGWPAERLPELVVARSSSSAEPGGPAGAAAPEASGSAAVVPPTLPLLGDRPLDVQRAGVSAAVPPAPVPQPVVFEPVAPRGRGWSASSGAAPVLSRLAAGPQPVEPPTRRGHVAAARPAAGVGAEPAAFALRSGPPTPAAVAPSVGNVPAVLREADTPLDVAVPLEPYRPPSASASSSSLASEPLRPAPTAAALSPGLPLQRRVSAETTPPTAGLAPAAPVWSAGPTPAPAVQLEAETAVPSAPAGPGRPVGPVRAASFASMFGSATDAVDPTEPTAPTGFTEVALQRADPEPASAPADPPPAPEPAAPPAAPAPAAAAAAGAPGPAGADLDEMARRLFEPLSARLRAELWLDRERAGMVLDAHG